MPGRERLHSHGAFVLSCVRVGGRRPVHWGVLEATGPQAHFLSSVLSQSGWAGRTLGSHRGQPFLCPGEKRKTGGYRAHEQERTSTLAQPPPQTFWGLQAVSAELSDQDPFKSSLSGVDAGLPRARGQTVTLGGP